MNQPPVEPAEESLRDLEFAPTDRLLREDVKQLGSLVGEILAEQVGPDFLAEVERVRRAAITRRETGAGVDDLFATLAGASNQRAADLVRAFATYFQAINLAERVHRIRRRRDYERDGQAPQPGGLRAVLQGLRDDGVSLDEIAELLPRLHIEPVFTAHPTEAVRQVLLEKEQEIVAGLVADIDRDRTPAERSADRERMRMVLTAGWQTAEAAPVRPTVADELEHVGFYLSNVLYRILPVFFEAFEAALAESHGHALPLPPLLRFGSWVGGDMDGNPNVGAATIAAALAAQRTLVRTAVVIVALAAFVVLAGKWSNPLAWPGRTWVFLVLSGLATGASWVCYFRALQVGEASKVAPVDKLSLVLVAVFAFTFLGERPSLREWSGIALVALGVLVLAIKR